MAKRSAKPKQDEPAEERRGRGRPSEYNPRLIKIIGRCARAGFTMEELAEVAQTSDNTLRRWMAEHEDFRRAIKWEDDPADDRIERSLYENAIAGDTTAQIFWLKNRRKAQWNAPDTTGGGALALLEQFMRLALSKVVITGEAHAVPEGRHAGDDPAVGQIPFGILPGSASSDS